MFIIAVVSGAIPTEEPLGQAGCCPERADGMGQAKGRAAGWYLPVSHQTITPCTRLVTGQLQLPAAPSTGINPPLASRHRLGGCPCPQTAYTLFLWFSAWERSQIPLLYSHLPHVARKEMKHLVPAATPSCFPSVRRGVASLEISFSVLGLPGWAPGDVCLAGELPCWLSMQRWGWNTHRCSSLHLTPEKTGSEKGLFGLACVPRLPSSAELHPWTGSAQDFELPRKFSSHLGFYFVN